MGVERSPASGSAGQPAAEVFLYQSAARIQPRQAKGRYANLRVLAMLALLGFYYVLPWLSWHGTPLVLFDLPARRFHLFGLTLVPQDLILLTGLLLVAALTLFFFTTLGGRLWCGYACPQTVWTEAFLWMEQLCEGDRYDRIKLDRSPWNRNKILRRGSRHVLWVVFSLFTGLTFVAYFVPAPELFGSVAHGELLGWPLFWTLFYGFMTWGNAGFMREQVCKYMCPYARFQSAMFDRDTLIIAYDEKRGEPRKSFARQLGQKAGDCVDCSLCVQVCPTGIDIRKGLQYECIACAACVDACNTVMDSTGKPHGLIRYTSARHDAGGPFRIFRPRAIGYGVVWVAACVALLALVGTHRLLRMDVLRDRHTLYREMADGAIENVYTLKITNDDDEAHRLKVEARLADGTALEAVPDVVELAAGETRAALVSLRTPPREEDAPKLPRVENARVSVQAIDEEANEHPLHDERTARFLTGDPR